MSAASSAPATWCGYGMTIRAGRRAPPHVRGKVGTVVAVHGQLPNPLDHRDLYPPLYTVRFDLQELTGRPSRDAVTADLHEDWLKPAHPPS